MFNIGQDQWYENIPEMKFVWDLKESEIIPERLSERCMDTIDWDNRDTCRWEGQLERTSSSKVRIEIGKIKLEIFGRSWKVTQK